MATITYPKTVVLRDIPDRNGFPLCEEFMPTAAKLWDAEEHILAGCKRIELTNFGNPTDVPHFKDAETLLKSFNRNLKCCTSA